MSRPIITLHQRVCPQCFSGEQLYTIETITCLYPVLAMNAPIIPRSVVESYGEEVAHTVVGQPDKADGDTQLWYTGETSHTIDEESSWPLRQVLCRSCSWQGYASWLKDISTCTRCGEQIHRLDEFTWLSTSDDSPTCSIIDGQVISHTPTQIATTTEEQ